MDFVDQIAATRGVSKTHPVVQYLRRKTRAADRGSKARLSLGNLYALHVLAEDYLGGRVSRFTDLKARMNAMPRGEKLQNHPLDNRLNDEFGRQQAVDGDLLPVQSIIVEGQKGRAISTVLLGHGGASPREVALVIVQTVNAYISRILNNQMAVLDEIETIGTITDLEKFFNTAFAPCSDARLFEIASYALLAEFFSQQHVYIGETPATVQRRPLRLFRTGRTNANDGGIDFVLQPLGEFFQVTETLDFKKYFLDFEKTNRYRMSFVIKIEGRRQDILQRIWDDAVRSGQYSDATLRTYMALFDRIYTLTDLYLMVRGIPPASLASIKATLSLQFQLEYGLLN